MSELNLIAEFFLAQIEGPKEKKHRLIPDSAIFIGTFIHDDLSGSYEVYYDKAAKELYCNDTSWPLGHIAKETSALNKAIKLIKKLKGAENENPMD
jgi:hypothetical protein